MIVVTDTFNWEDYPVYVRGSKDLAAQRAHELEHTPMSKVMEVYDLNGDKAAQMAEERTWAVPRPSPAPSTLLAEALLEQFVHLADNLPRCPECGGRVELVARAGRTRELVKGTSLEVPEDVEIPTCTACGEESMTLEISDPLDARLWEALLAR